MTDLDRLIETVEAGFDRPTNWRDFNALPPISGIEPSPPPILAHRAYHGSLDAALALKDALLPGWGWSCDFWCDAEVIHPSGPVAGHYEAAESITPARALLLATLNGFAATQKEPTP